MANLHEKPPQVSARRRFKHSTAFCDGTKYVEFKGDRCTLISDDGRRKSTRVITIEDAELLAEAGSWVEVPADGKQPRLFYFEDAVNAWAPVPAALEDGLLDWLYYELEGDDSAQPEPVQFRRDFLTDDEFDAIPEE